MQLAVCIPVYNDWQSVSLLLQRLDTVAGSMQYPMEVLLVDDGSTQPPGDDLRRLPLRSLNKVAILPLRRNVGHQRAIAISLAYIEQHLPCSFLVIMDGDGEDAPEDVPKLVAKLVDNGCSKIVFAERTRRSEDAVFRFFYTLYCWAHRVLTGVAVKVGNFSAVPASLLRRLTVVSELWNHYSAAVFKSRIPYEMLPTQRATRLHGLSQMSFVSLVSHGLSALSVHGDRVGVRMLIVVTVCMLLLGLGVLSILITRLFTDFAVPGWASMFGGLALVLGTQGVALIIVFLFMTLQSRTMLGFLPARDYHHFTDEPVQIFPRPLTCSPKVEPGGMRVSTGLKAQETLDERTSQA